MKTRNLVAAVWLTSLAVFGLMGCMPRIATPAAEMNATQAHQTVQALVSQGAATQAASGAITPSPVLVAWTASPTVGQPQPSPTRAAPLSTNTPLPPSPTPVCDRAAAGSPIDVTIPDETVYQPDESFTKIWRLENVGTCTWTRRYAARFFYGSMMEAPELVYLAQEVMPGQSVDIAVDMVAPATPGAHQGNWKLQNAEGQLFGMGPNGDAPFWVRIVVVLPATSTPTLTPTSTATPTPTPTPTLTATPTPTLPAAASGAVKMQSGQVLDLDTGSLNNSEAADLGYQVDANGFHVLTPQAGTIMGVFGLLEPVPAACQVASMSAAPLAFESLTPGSFLCYQTDQAQFGRLRYLSLDAGDQSVSLDFRTWIIP